MNAANLIRFDEQSVPGASLDDLEPALWQRFRTEQTHDERDDLLIKLGMARSDDDGITHPTVAGVLLAAVDPRRWLPNAFIQAVAYRGTEVVSDMAPRYYQLDLADLTGPLDHQALEAVRFVRRNMRVRAYKDGMGRVDVPQFDLKAVFEAVVNAVAHRDYSIYGSKIRLRLFSDRLELYSPGAIPNTMTVESLPYRQVARNEAVTSLLAKCPIPDDADWLQTSRRTLMDRRGEGVRVILERSEHLAKRRPEYRLLDDAELLLVIYAAGDDDMPAAASA